MTAAPGYDLGQVATTSTSALLRADTSPAGAPDGASALGDALLGVCSLSALSGTVIAGGLAVAGARLIDPVVERMTSRRGIVTVPPITTASLGGRAGLLGAALVARDALIGSGPASGEDLPPSSPTAFRRCGVGQ